MLIAATLVIPTIVIEEAGPGERETRTDLQGSFEADH
jgi:hypothetical protein